MDRYIALRPWGTIRPRSDSKLRMLFIMLSRARASFRRVLRNRRGLAVQALQLGESHAWLTDGRSDGFGVGGLVLARSRTALAGRRDRTDLVA